MWAQRLVAPYTFEKVEVTAPQPGDLHDGQVLIRVLAGGICGSDLPYFKGALPPVAETPTDGYDVTPAGSPLHEVVGEVVASRDPTISVGSRVVGWAPRMNGLQEYLVVDGEGIFEYDAVLSPTSAVMLQPLACVIFALERLPTVSGKSAAVIGQGPIGVLFSHVLKTFGAGHMTGVDRVDRSDVAAAFKVDEVVQASSAVWAASLRAETQRPQLIVEAVGHQVGTLRDAVEAVAFDGHIYYFGIPNDPVYPFPMTTFLRKNAKLTSGFTSPRQRRSALRKADDYVKVHPALVDAYITNVFKTEATQQAFDLAARPARGQLKVVLTTE
jgi:threonine dehydrogenase-like Zn-dependent dehydrogenase